MIVEEWEIVDEEIEIFVFVLVVVVVAVELGLVGLVLIGMSVELVVMIVSKDVDFVLFVVGEIDIVEFFIRVMVC